MELRRRRTHLRSAALVAALTIAAGPVPAQSPPLAYETSIALPGVTGRIDHMEIDGTGNRLFIAALGNGSLEVVDLEHRRHLRRVSGLHEPQGVRLVPAAGRLFVANGRSGTVDVFSSGSLAPLASITGLEGADNIRSEPPSEWLYVGYDGGLAVIDSGGARVVARIPLTGHPESFQLEKSGRRLFANVPSTRQVVAVDRERGTVLAQWPIRDAQDNFPMALDEENHRLFVATRRPAALLVLDTNTGREVARLPTCGDSDDLFFDEKRRRIYVVCGAGEVDVVHAGISDRFESVGRVKTRPGARTGLFVPGQSSLYVAAPAKADRPAAVLVLRAN